MSIKGIFKNRSFKYGSYSIILTVAVIVVLILVNGILSLPSIRDRVTFDVTKNKLFSIGQQTDDALKALKKDVDVYIMSPENKYTNSLVIEALKQYVIKGSGKVKSTQYIDLDKDPTFISKNLDPNQVQGIAAGDVVIKSGSNIKVLTDADFTETSYDQYTGASQVTGIKVEQAITAAILSVTADKAYTVGFVSGHGEIGAAQTSQLRSTISLNNYKIQDINLTSAIDGIDILVFAAPTDDLLPKELESVLTYLDKGGKAIFMFDVPKEAKDLPNFNQIFNKYYLNLNTDLVSEFNQQNYLQENWMLVPRIYQSTVTQNLNSDQLSVYLPACRSVDIMGQKDGITIDPLFGTTDNSQSVDLKTNSTKNGPFYIGAMSSIGVDVDKASRIAVIGNCAFITDSFMQQVGDNGSRYIISMLNWMQDNGSSILIPSKSLEAPPLNLTQQSTMFIFILVIAVIPLIIIGFGVFVWVRRKNL